MLYLLTTTTTTTKFIFRRPPIILLSDSIPEYKIYNFQLIQTTHKHTYMHSVACITYKSDYDLILFFFLLLFSPFYFWNIANNWFVIEIGFSFRFCGLRFCQLFRKDLLYLHCLLIAHCLYGQMKFKSVGAVSSHMCGLFACLNDI